MAAPCLPTSKLSPCNLPVGDRFAAGTCPGCEEAAHNLTFSCQNRRRKALQGSACFSGGRTSFTSKDGLFFSSARSSHQLHQLAKQDRLHSPRLGQIDSCHFQCSSNKRGTPLAVDPQRMPAHEALARDTFAGLPKLAQDSLIITSNKPNRIAATEAAPERAESWGFVKTKLAIFVSGGGSNFRAIQQSILEDKIYGEVVVVVSDKPECGGCAYAREHNIPVLAFPRGKFAPDGISSSELVESLRRWGVEYVVLAGYLKLLPSELVAAYPRAILNIHPALLPSFGGKGYYGIKVHTAVIQSGARFSGPTVHFVDEKYDNGPIVAQRVVPVLPFDTPQDLQARVLAEEHELYSYVLAALCEDRITWREDGVPLIRKSWNGSEYV